MPHSVPATGAPVDPRTAAPFDALTATPVVRPAAAGYRHGRPALRLVRERAPAYGPAADVDALEELGDEIATLAAHIHAATHRLLALIADFDRRRGWELDGHRSCAHWLAFRTGIDLGAAREKVRTARALVGLPATAASMARGELSFSKVRALTRVATAGNEADLLELARGCTVAALEQVVRGWKGRTPGDEAARERANHEARTFSVFPDEDGMYVVRGRLEPEVAAVLMKAVEAAGDALFQEGGAPGLQSEEASRRVAAQRRADAVGLLAERALAAGFGGVGGDGDRDVPVSGSRAARYQVVLHVDAEGLSETGDGHDGGGERGLEDGTRVYLASREELAECVSVCFAPHQSGRSVQLKRPGGSPATRGW